MGVAMGFGYVCWNKTDEVGRNGVDNDLDADEPEEAERKEEQEQEAYRIEEALRAKEWRPEGVLLDEAAAEASVRDNVVAIIVCIAFATVIVALTSAERVRYWCRG